MKINLLILLLFVGLTNCQSQRRTDPERPAQNPAVPVPENAEIQVELHFRVDTTNKDVQEIVTLWTHYLNSEPDKISDNPSWNEEEKLKYEDFDLSRALLYQFPSAQLLRNYPPKVLSIEQEGEHYAIRTMYAAEGLEGDYRRSNPWAIQKLYAVRENNQWRLKNALPILTRRWNRTTIGKITYIYSPDHAFDEALAIKANEFCNRITTQFQFPDWAPFDYYIAHNADELGRLLNFDFFAAGYTTGIGFNAERMLLSGFGSEYYPHEFVHLVVPQVARHSLLEEGFATWQGGQGGKTFDETAQVFANALAQNDTVRFQDVVDRTWGWQYAGFYITGAILCHTAYQKGGAKLVNDLLQIPPGDDRLVEHLCSVFGLAEKDFDGFWRGASLKFKGD